MNYINNSHLKSHGLTPTQLKEMYPEVDAIAESSRKKMGENGNLGAEAVKAQTILKYKNNPKKCKNCYKEMPYNKRNNTFCNNSCAASYLNKNRIVVYSEKGLNSLRENAFKQKNNLKIKKVKVLKVEKKKCTICDNEFTTTYKNKLNKTCSHKCKKKQHAINNHRQNKTFGKCGYYHDTYCASSWELAFLIYNLDLGKDIKRCELTFKYNIAEEEHLYFPDFIMDGTIYEVKGRELEDVALKTQAVIESGYIIQLIRKKEITPIIKSIKEKYGVKDITKLYDKKI